MDSTNITQLDNKIKGINKTIEDRKVEARVTAEKLSQSEKDYTELTGLKAPKTIKQIDKLLAEKNKELQAQYTELSNVIELIESGQYAETLELLGLEDSVQEVDDALTETEMVTVEPIENFEIQVDDITTDDINAAKGAKKEPEKPAPEVKQEEEVKKPEAAPIVENTVVEEKQQEVPTLTPQLDIPTTVPDLKPEAPVAEVKPVIDEKPLVPGTPTLETVPEPTPTPEPGPVFVGLDLGTGTQPTTEVPAEADISLVAPSIPDVLVPNTTKPEVPKEGLGAPVNIGQDISINQTPTLPGLQINEVQNDLVDTNTNTAASLLNTDLEDLMSFEPEIGTLAFDDENDEEE